MHECEGVKMNRSQIGYKSKEYGASLLEMGLIICFVFLVGITAIPALRYKVEAYTWFIGLFMTQHEFIQEDGSRYYLAWVPEGAFRTFSSIIPPAPWCYVKIFSDGKTPPEIVTSAVIQSCGDRPTS
jgi:hypothetical protein